MIIAIDFDGTIVEHKYPQIGKPVPGAFDIMKKWKGRGHKLILWTCRTEELLEEAVEFCRTKGLIFNAVNENIPNSVFTPWPKVYADLYIDDRNLCGSMDWKFADAYVAAREYYYNEIARKEAKRKMPKSKVSVIDKMAFVSWVSLFRSISS